jgi:PTS system glucose-specific IIC component
MLAYQFAGKVVTLSDGTQYVINMKDFVNVTLPGGVVFSSANPGQYMQGKYPFMIFGLPAAALAMVMAAPKGQNRKLAFSTVIGAALTSFVTGITEPIEFTFLFLAPALFYGFHAVAVAISFWLMNLLKANMGMTFSGGFIDFAIYGILPDVLGGKADC